MGQPVEVRVFSTAPGQISVVMPPVRPLFLQCSLAQRNPLERLCPHSFAQNHPSRLDCRKSRLAQGVDQECQRDRGPVPCNVRKIIGVFSIGGHPLKPGDPANPTAPAQRPRAAAPHASTSCRWGNSPDRPTRHDSLCARAASLSEILHSEHRRRLHHMIWSSRPPPTGNAFSRRQSPNRGVNGSEISLQVRRRPAPLQENLWA